MATTGESTCNDQGGHQRHICQLKKEGALAEVAARSDAPGFICHNCNAAANQAEHLCNPSPMLQRS